MRKLIFTALSLALALTACQVVETNMIDTIEMESVYKNELIFSASDFKSDETLDTRTDIASGGGFLCRHVVVALHVLFDLFQRLAGMLGQALVQGLLDAQDLLGVDGDVRRLALVAAEGLASDGPQTTPWVFSQTAAARFSSP